MEDEYNCWDHIPKEFPSSYLMNSTQNKTKPKAVVLEVQHCRKKTQKKAKGLCESCLQ